MKKLTHLVNYKTKQMKNVKTYNPFDIGDNNDNDDDGNYEMSHKKTKFQLKMKSKNHNNNKQQLEQTYEPKVHNKNNKNKKTKTTTTTTSENAIANSTKTKAAGGSNKFLMTLTKAKKSKHEQQLKPSVSCTSTSSSTSRTAFNGSGSDGGFGATGAGGDGRNGNNINYNSLERMRNSSCNSTQSIKVHSHKRKWPYLWWKRYGRHRKPLTKTWRLKTKLSCWRQLRKKLSSCCKHSSSSSSAAASYQYNSDEDDDIDAKFNAYVCELQRRDALEAAKEAEEKKAKLTKLEGEKGEIEVEICKTLMPTISMTNHPDPNTKETNNFTITKPTTCHTSTLTPKTQKINLETSTLKATTPTINTTITTTSTTTNNYNLNSHNNRVSFAGLPPRHNQSLPHNTPKPTTTLQRRHSQHLSGQQSANKSRRAWTWDDSLRSNSDRFLETLEEDADINDFVIIPSDSFTNTTTTSVNSSRCSVTRSRPSLQQLLTSPDSDEEDVNGDDVINDFVVILGEEAKAAAEELNRSPVMGQRNIDPTSSPIQSRGSASSDNWPTQSDEDIDRLVAMHQNRSSLSSLGLRSDSMASVYSGAGEGRYGTVVVKGQVEFGMQYNYKLGALEIHVVRCKDLAAVDAKRNRSDPYVKVYLLPDKSKAGKRKTKVKKHTLNPIFDEVLRFHMPISNLESRTLWLTVWHSDMFGRNDFLGEVSVNLQGRVFDNPQSQWYLLQERSEPFDEVATYRGDIVVGLKYVTPEGSKSKFMRAASLATGGGLRKFGSIKSVASSKTDRSAKGGQLHVLVKEAKHLTPIKPNGSCDAFCKSYLLPDRTRSSKQKTPIVKRSTNPSWNYTFIYEDVSLEDLSERALELTVWDHDRLASNEFLGGVRFSLGTCKSYGRQVDWMDASGKELSLWQNMLDRPNFWVEGSVVLRSTLDGIRAIP